MCAGKLVLALRLVGCNPTIYPSLFGKSTRSSQILAAAVWVLVVRFWLTILTYRRAVAVSIAFYINTGGHVYNKARQHRPLRGLDLRSGARFWVYATLTQKRAPPLRPLLAALCFW